MNLAASLVGEELRQRLGSGRDVAVQDRVAGRGVGPVPLDEPLEEDPDHAEPLTAAVLRQALALVAGLGGEPHLVVLDVATSRSTATMVDVGARGDEPAGELAQRAVGGVHAAGSQERGELDQVAAHRCRQLAAPGRTARATPGATRGEGTTARRRATAVGRSPVDLLDGEQLGGGRRVDPSRRPPVLAGEPVVGQVQVDASRFDRAVSGLGLDRFELPCRPRAGGSGRCGAARGTFPAPGRPGGGRRQDLVEPRRGERPSPGRALQRHEHPIRVRPSRGARGRGSRRRCEERVRRSAPPAGGRPCPRR